jgi:hypothetical protein
MDRRFPRRSPQEALASGSGGRLVSTRDAARQIAATRLQGIEIAAVDKVIA